VLAGYIRWPEYRSAEHPNMIRVEHHKTRRMVLHPLEETQVGERVLFYPEAEEIWLKPRDVGFQCAAEVPRWNLCALDRHAH